MGMMERLGNLLQRSRTEREIRAEIEAHLALSTEENLERGMTAEEAGRNARIRFGNPVAMEERTADADLALGLDRLWFDLRHAVRQLRHSPGFTLTAIVTLAMAIGANAVVFSVLHALVLRPLALPGARSLYMIEQRGVPVHSYPDYLDLRARTRSFEDVALYDFAEVGLDTGGDPRAEWVYDTTGNYFGLLGIRPYLGRFYQSSDEHGLDTVPYAVLSYDLWRTRFLGDPSAVSRTVELNRHPFTILGVAPPGFRGTEMIYAPGMWVPMVDQQTVTDGNLTDRSERSLFMIGRLRAGVSPAQATGELNRIGADLARSYPGVDDGLAFSLAQPGLVGDVLGSPVRAFVAGLSLLSTLILLAACANLGCLFAARAADRTREIALRVALGSTRARILRQLLAEALLLSLAGGVAGLSVSVVLLKALSTWRPSAQFPITLPVQPDAATFFIAVLLSLVSGLLCGLVPVRQVFGQAPWEVIRTGGSRRPRRRWLALPEVLLMVEISACAVLMIASLVAVRGLARSLQANLGFEPDAALLVDTDLRMAGYRGDRAVAMERRLLDAAARVPGVGAVGSIDILPLGIGFSQTTAFADGSTDLRESRAAALPMEFTVSPGYLRAARTSLLAGRDLSWHDDRDAPAVAIINRALAERIFGSVERAVGGHLLYGAGGTRVEVAGVVENGRYVSLAEETRPALFRPLPQAPGTNTWLVARLRADDGRAASALGEAIRRVDNGLPFTVATWKRSLDSALFPARAAAISLGVLGVLGAVLSVTGIFGMTSYLVSRRLREMGIRRALGAGPLEVLRSALGRALRLLALGSVAGALLGMAATRLLSVIVYQATPLDPAVLAGTTMGMLFVGLAATWAPAERALHVRPAILLREE